MSEEAADRSWTRRAFLGGTAAALIEAGIGCRRPAVDEPPYIVRRSAFRTKLLRRGPSPQSFTAEAPPEGVREIRYRSGELELPAWLRVARDAPSRAPAIVYFHGGFAFGADDLVEAARPLGEGRVLLCPTLRAENGNPGTFEMFLSEVDDAKAAIRWLAAQPFVDPDRIYTFGHSAGGVISALLSLHDDVPCRLGASSGGLYDTNLFAELEQCPFDPNDATECRMRLLVGNIRWMRKRHIAYCGTDDPFQAVRAARREAGSSSLLEVKMIEGDHRTSLEPAAQDFAARIAKG